MDEGSKRQFTINISSAAVIKTVVVLALFWFLFFIKDMVIVILTSIVIAAAIEPLISWCIKRRIPRTIGVLAMYLVIAGLLAGIFYVFVPSLVADISDLSSQLPTYINSISVWNPLNINLSATSPVVQNFGLASGFSFNNLVGEINGLFANTSGGFVQAISTLFGGVFSLVLIVVLSFYLAVQDDGIAKFLRIVLPIQYENYALDLWHRSQQKIGRWLQGQLLLGILIGILVYLGLTILGVRNALLLSLLAMMFEIIPIFGPILASIPSTVVALLDGGITKGILVIGLYVIVHQFENHLIYPLVVKKIVGIPPIIVIIALIIGFKLAGVLGILLSVPVAAVLVEWLDDVHREKVGRAKTALGA